MVCILVGVNQVYINDPDNKELVTLIECIGVLGYHLLAMITFKGIYYLWKYFDNDMDGNTLWSRSNTGFINNKLTLK